MRIYKSKQSIKKDRTKLESLKNPSQAGRPISNSILVFTKLIVIPDNKDNFFHNVFPQTITEHLQRLRTTLFNRFPSIIDTFVGLRRREKNKYLLP